MKDDTKSKFFMAGFSAGVAVMVLLRFLSQHGIMFVG